VIAPSFSAGMRLGSNGVEVQHEFLLCSIISKVKGQNKK